MTLGQSGASFSSAEAGRRGEAGWGRLDPRRGREGGGCARGALVGPKGRHYRRGHLSKAWGWKAPAHRWTRGGLAGSPSSPG